MEIIFPQHLEDFSEIKSIEDALTKLNLENVSLSSNLQYRWIKQKDRYIYGRCKYQRCRASLTYRLHEEVYRLVRSEVAHNHSFQGSKKSLFTSIESEIKDLPNTISTQAAKALICRKHNIPSSTFYYLFRKIKHLKISYWSLTKLMTEKKCDVHSDPYEYGMEKLPNVMLIVSPLMKQNFLKFGDWMGFDLTYNLVQEVSEEGRKWGLGVFMGISSSKKLVPFGLVLTNQQTAKAFYQIFKSFSEIMNKLPSVIISDEDKAVIAALESLKEDREFQGAHLLDCFHILRNVKKNLKNKSCWQFFNRLIREQSKEKFKQITNQCLQAMEQEEDVTLLKRFLENSHRYCLSQTSRHLYGFMPNTTMNEKTHDLIKRILPFSKPFTVVVQKVFNYLQDLGLKCYQYEIESAKMEDIFHYMPLKELRYSVCKQIFKEVINQLSKSIHHLLFQQSETLFEVKDHQAIFQVNKAEEIWNCNCQFYQKSGVLCSHQCRVLLFLRLPFTDYIHNRWKIEIKQEEKMRKKYSYQRKTRRNKK